MEFKKLIIILTITITLIFAIMMGVSYGWYAYTNAESTLTASTIKEKPSIIFAQTEYIKLINIAPIYDEDRYNYASKNSFNITIGENLQKYETAIELVLTNIEMDEELKIANYKYELLQDGKVVANGNFENIGFSTSVVLMPMTLIKPSNYPKTYRYELYIWLSEDNTNQNNLMNKKFSAKINVTSATKSK